MPLSSGSRPGAGGMREVYRARDPRLARDVANKVLRGDSGLTEESRRRFDIEAKAASRLNHPKILTVYELGEDGGTPYIVSD
jgi:eukaryotic-like serine/threonine-protein kinase